VEVDLASDVAEMALVSLDVSAASSVSISTGSLAFSAGDFGGDFGGGGLVFVLGFVDVRGGGGGGGDLVMSVCSLSTCSAWS
jgi:hypothetical protein